MPLMAAKEERRRRGSGTWYESDGSWIASYPLGVRNGKRVRKRIRCASENAAKAELEKLRRKYASGIDPATETLDAFLAEWLASREQTVAASTLAQYRNHVDLHIRPLLGGIEVGKLGDRDVKRLIADRLAHTSASTHRPLSPNTVAHIVTTLRIALGSAVEAHALPYNVAKDGIRLPRAERPPIEPMTEAEAIRLDAAFDGHPCPAHAGGAPDGRCPDCIPRHWLSPLVRLLAGSGLRLGEALSLNQGDADPDKGFVRLRKSKTTIRAVPISHDAAAAIRAALAAAPRRGKDEPLFFGPRVNRAGDRARLTRYTVSHAVPKVIVAAGLARLTPHGFRHGAATRMVAKGVHMRYVAAQLGHANPALTAKVYAHVIPESQRDAVNLLDRAESAPG